MKGKAAFILVGIVLAGIALLTPNSVLVSNAYADEVRIICNKSVPAGSLNQEVIKDIFLGKMTQWNNGQKIIIVTLKNKEIHDVFLEKYIHKTSEQYTTYWKKIIFTGRGKAPLSFDKEEELVDYVSRTQGAIGYIPSGATKNKDILEISWKVQGSGSES